MKLPIEWIISLVAVSLALYIIYGRPLVKQYISDSKHKSLHSKLVYQVERRHMPEFHPLLMDIVPNMGIFRGLNLTTEYFHNNKWDTKFQQQCASLNLTEENMAYLSQYEKVMAGVSNKTILGEFPNRTFELVKKNQISWMLSAGRLSHGKMFKKSEMMKHFERTKGVVVTGVFYYPPGGYTVWHTNRYERPGWRMYYTKVIDNGKSFFAYRDPKNGEIHKVFDKHDHYNIFFVETKEQEALWHCVFSDTHRISIGLNVPEHFVQLVIDRSIKNERISSFIHP